jgi:hypothetical protein
MICLLVCPGIKILPNDVALLLSKVKTDSGTQIPSLISSVEFDHDDTCKLSTSKTIAEQCRHAIIQIPINQADHKGKKLSEIIQSISIIWVCQTPIGLDSLDGIAVAALFQFSASRFQRKMMSIFTTTNDSPKELALICFAQTCDFNLVISLLFLFSQKIIFRYKNGLLVVITLSRLGESEIPSSPALIPNSLYPLSCRLIL